MKNTHYVKTGLLSFALYTLSAVSIVASQTGMAHAETAAPAAVHAVAQTAQVKAQGDFIRKAKKLKGSYSIVEENGQTIIRFADNFKTVNGPDLKVFLSPQTVEGAKGSTATQDAVLLGFIKSETGTQDYIVPAGVSLANFNSVLIHCEAFSVLWGGGNI